MKKTLLLLTALAVSLSAFSEILSPEDALNRVMSTKNGRHLAKSASNVKLMKTYTEASQPAVYLFSRGSDSGYLVLSAESETDAVLGYCDNGKIDTNNMPAAMTYWMEQYAKQIAYLRANSSQNRANAATNVHNEIPILCKTNWSQKAPYNNDCPWYKDSSTSVDKCVTGCAATAYAQVLKYHKWPTAEALAGDNQYDTYTYTWQDLGLGHTGVYSYSNGTATQLSTLSFTFKDHVFDWENMNDYYISYTSEQGAAVADLMHACGVLFDMDYGQESGAESTAMIHTYKYMHLDDEITIVMRNYYNRQEWIDLIYNALKVGPVMYGGQSCDGGHEFVCDGYNNGYFHINWGWSGQFNGYFMLDALEYTGDGISPSAGGFNFDQDAILYIQPERTGTSPAHYNVLCDNFYIESNSNQKVGSSISVLSPTKFYSTLPMSGQLMLKIATSDGSDPIYITGDNFNNCEFGTEISGPISYTLPESLSDGTYIVTPAFMVNDEHYDVRCNRQKNQAYQMVVNDGVCTFTTIENAQIKSSDFTLKSELATGTTFNATATLINSNDSEYCGYLTVAIIDSSNKFLAWGDAALVSVPANGEYAFSYAGDFGNYTLTPGTEYKLVIAEADAQGYDNFTPKSIISNIATVTAVNTPTRTMYATTPVVNDNNTDVDRENIVIKTNVTTNYYFSGKIYALIYSSTGTGMGLLSSDPVVIDNTTAEVSIKASMPILEYENKYTAILYDLTSYSSMTAATGCSTTTSFTISAEPQPEPDIQTAVNSIATDNGAVSTELYTLQGVRVNANTAAPGIYIKLERLANGQTRTSRIIIK